MTAKTLSNGILRTILIVASIIGIGWLLFSIQTIIIYIIIAAILTLISRPLLNLLSKRFKIPNTLSAIIALVLIVGIFIVFINLFAPLVSKQSQNISMLNEDSFYLKVEMLSSKVNQYLSSKGIHVQEKLKEIDYTSFLSDVPNVLNVIVGSLGSFGIGMFSVFFISFFFMVDDHLLKNTFFIFIPKQHLLKSMRSVETIKDMLSRYFIGLSIQIGVLFILYSILLSILGIENALIIALLCALLNLVPYVGPLVGAILMFILVATNNIHLDFQTQIIPTTIYVMIGYFIAQMIDNFVSQPLIFSKSVNSHPLEIFLIISIFGSLFGIIGMVVSVPTYTAIKVILKAFFNENKMVQRLTRGI